MKFMTTHNYKQTIVHCTDLNTSAKADIIQQNDNMIKVAFVGSAVTMTLHRTESRRPYVGNYMKMEFSTTGKELA